MPGIYQRIGVGTYKLGGRDISRKITKPHRTSFTSLPMLEWSPVDSTAQQSKQGWQERERCGHRGYNDDDCSDSKALEQNVWHDQHAG